MTNHECPPPATPRPEEEIIEHIIAHWFTQGGQAQFGELLFDGRAPNNPDELIVAILTKMRAPSAPEAPTAEAARVRSPQYSEWQPIETAPKDGTVIIGALITDGTVWRVHEMSHSGLAFYTVSGHSVPRMTHWIPMPAQASSLRPQAGLGDVVSAGSPSDLANCLRCGHGAGYHEALIGELSPCRCAGCGCADYQWATEIQTVHDLKLEIATLRSTHATLQSALLKYGQHLNDCAVWKCVHCGYSESMHDLTIDLDEITCLFQGLTFTAKMNCTCGLAALNGAPGTE